MAELDVAIKLAREAGAAVMKIYNTEFSHEIKEDKSPVTEADILSDKIIRDGLKKAFPEDGILSEETLDDGARLRKERVWIVDPIDGTKEFLNKNGEFCISIGLVEHKKPVLGVIYAPAIDILYYTDNGAWKEQAGKKEKISVNTNTENLHIPISRSHPTEQEASFAEQGTPIPKGSCLKICSVAAGETEAYFCSANKLQEYDLCGAHAILEAAGGKITALNGEEIRYNNKDISTPGFLATNKVLHKPLLEKWIE